MVFSPHLETLAVELCEIPKSESMSLWQEGEWSKSLASAFSGVSTVCGASRRECNSTGRQMLD